VKIIARSHSHRLAKGIIAAALLVVLGYFVSRVLAATTVGDLNSDGVVNVLDLSELLSNWGTTNQSITSNLGTTGPIGIFDLSTLLSHWGDSTPTSTPSLTPTPSATPAGQYFGLAPLGTALPRTDAYCAANVESYPERIAANVTANHDVPPAGTNFQWGPWSRGTAGLQANIGAVDGNFSGSTDEILEWAACKWGWDQNYAKAEAVSESSWVQSTVGDNGDSFGILQVKAATGLPASLNNGWGGYPWTENSTALDADAQMAYLRACYDGKLTYFGSSYQAGNVWSCVGSWFSGAWEDSAGSGYASRVQAHLANQDWLTLH
jgi:autotransporter family porin